MNIPNIFQLLNDAEIPDFLKKKKDPIDLFISKEKPSDFNSFVKSKNNEVVTDNKKGPVIEKSSQLYGDSKNVFKKVDQDFDNFQKLQELNKLSKETDEMDEHQQMIQQQKQAMKDQKKLYKKIQKEKDPKSKAEFFKELAKLQKNKDNLEKQTEVKEKPKKKSAKEKARQQRLKGQSSIVGWKSDEAFKLRQQYD